MSEMRNIQEKALYTQATPRDHKQISKTLALGLFCRSVFENDKQWIAALHKPRYAKATVAA